MISNVKIVLNIMLIIFMFCMPVYADKNCNYTQNIIKYKEYLEALMNDKAIIYNALNLSDCQRQEFEQITQKNTKIYKQKLEELIKEAYKYKAQQSANFTFAEQYKQKNNINRIKNEISCVSAKEDKDLLKILNRHQRSKYRYIKHLERHDLRKEYHPKNYYKLNPLMTIFGGE